MSDASDPQSPAAIPPEEEDREGHDARYSKLLRQKCGEFLDHLLRSLDMVAYCHFSYLYFLDCSLFRFLIRSAIQLNYLTPKPPNFPVHSQRRPAIVALFGSTAFCFLCHVFSAAPSAGELSNGYLHGGFIIDFVGQEGPVSKWRLVFMDATVLALQIVMLGLVVSKQEQDAAVILTEERRNAPPVQDLDAEERGETRGHSVPSSPSPPPPSPQSPSADHNHFDADPEMRGEAEAPLINSDEPTISAIIDGSSEAERERQRRIFELTSGEFMVAELRVIDVLRRQWQKDNVQTTGGEDGSRSAGEETGVSRHV